MSESIDDQIRVDDSLREAAREPSNDLTLLSNALVYVRFVGGASARRREAVKGAHCGAERGEADM